MTNAELIKEIGEWATFNFDFHCPQLGLAEELGEYCHQVLKKKQQIRKTSESQAMDAIGDATIYLFHICYKQGINDLEPVKLLPIKEIEYIGELYENTGKLIRFINEGSPLIVIHLTLRKILTKLKHLAIINGWDFESIINKTWEEVSRRNWRKFPKNGLTE